MSETPDHYAGEVTPWDLERCMKSTGNAFVDSRRSDAIEYAFRIKDDPVEDLRKAAHCLIEAANELEGNAFQQGPESNEIEDLFRPYREGSIPGLCDFLESVRVRSEGQADMAQRTEDEAEYLKQAAQMKRFQTLIKNLVKELDGSEKK